LATLLDTGELPLLTELRAKFPRTLLELKSVPGLGANRIKLLAELLNIRSRDDLMRAIESGSLAGFKGFGPKIQERLRKFLAVETVASREALEARYTSKPLKLRTCRFSKPNPRARRRKG
jgi:DNA polymerase/3'-5' exonuclease PolX